MTTGLPQPLQAVISKKFAFSVGLIEDSFTSRARRQYLINSILDRSVRRTSALNIGVSETATQDDPSSITGMTIARTLLDTVQDPQALSVNSAISLVL